MRKIPILFISLFTILFIGFLIPQDLNVIGTVGTSGNAAEKPPHLHYSIVTAIPYVWKMDSDIQGWMKMFYLNPIEYL